ncbi:MAG: U32 family peptidase [Candidatus Omnitrophica bacterium]|nr:U32 family peptidase [Candidatus Omnitrophota bacterium]
MKKRIAHKIKFSIPYNGDIDLIKWAIGSGQVYEVYFSGPVETDYSSAYQNLKTYSSVEIDGLVRLCAQKSIGRNFLINKSILYFENVKKILQYMKRLETLGGLTAVTVADRMIVPIIKQAFPKLTIQSSVFLHIDSASKVREAVKMGISGFCLDVSANRNGEELEKIRKLKKIYPEITIKLLANHGCYSHCFYAPKHEDWPVLRSLQAKRSRQGEYILGDMINERKCVFKTENLADEIRRPFIRPEDVGFYEQNQWADYIKIAYRLDTTPVLRRKLKAFFERKYIGDIFDLAPSNRGGIKLMCANTLFPANFVRKVCSCASACDKCSYCLDVAARVFVPFPSVNLS